MAGRHGRAGRAGRRADGGGWGGRGAFSLVGRSATDPLAETAGGFAIAAALGIGWAWLAGFGPVSALAAVSGAVASGQGYAFRHAALPRPEASAAGLAQLTVPVLAILNGAALLGESPDARVRLAGAAIPGGVAPGLVPPRRHWRPRGRTHRSVR